MTRERICYILRSSSQYIFIKTEKTGLKTPSKQSTKIMIFKEKNHEIYNSTLKRRAIKNIIYTTKPTDALIITYI